MVDTPIQFTVNKARHVSCPYCKLRMLIMIPVYTPEPFEVTMYCTNRHCGEVTRFMAVVVE